MNTYTSSTVNVPAQSIQTNRVLRNTYALPALTLLFSSVTAGLGVFAYRIEIIESGD